MDWDKVYLALLEYKASKGLSNLIVQPEIFATHPGSEI